MAWRILTNKKPTEAGFPYLFTEWQLTKISEIGPQVPGEKVMVFDVMGNLHAKKTCVKKQVLIYGNPSKMIQQKEDNIKHWHFQQLCTLLPENSWKKAWGPASLLDMWVGIEPSSSTAWGVASQRSSGWWCESAVSPIFPMENGG